MADVTEACTIDDHAPSALAGARATFADRRLATAVFLALKLAAPAAARRRTGRRQDRTGQGAVGARLQRQLVRLQCYDGLEQREALYEWNYAAQLLHMRAAAARHGRSASAAIEREVYQERYLIRRPLLQALQAPAPGRGAADRRDRPCRRTVRGLPARVPGRIPGQHSRDGHGARRRRRRSPCSPATAHANSTTRSSGAACTTGWTTPIASANWPSCAPRCRRPRAQLSQQVADFVERLRSAPFASAFHRAPGIAESVEWARALVALDTLVLDPEVVQRHRRHPVQAARRRGGADARAGRRTAQARGGAGRPLTERVQQLGDARTRQAGRQPHRLRPCPAPCRHAVDGARMALASEAVTLVGVDRREDVAAALEAVLVSREHDREVFRELFDAWFRDPSWRQQAARADAAQRRGQGRSRSSGDRACARRWRRRARRKRRPQPKGADGRARCRHDGQRPGRLRHADFNALARQRIPPGRAAGTRHRAADSRIRARAACAGDAARSLHWPGVLHEAARTGGEMAAAAPPAAPPPAPAAAGAGRRVGLDGALCAPAAGLPACSHAPLGAGATCSPSAPT